MKWLPGVLLCSGIVTGCAALPGKMPAAPVSAPANAAIAEQVVVSLYRLGAVRVSIPHQGATLRSAIADARDLASRGGGIILTHAINLPVLLEHPTSPAQNKEHTANLESMLLVGEECIVLSRGATRLVVPEVLVTSTALGSIRITSDDIVQSIPLALVDSLRESSGGLITVSGDRYDVRQIRVHGDTQLGLLSQFPAWRNPLALDAGEPPSTVNSGMLRPNVATVSRNFNGIRHLLVFPCNVNEIGDQIQPDSELMHQGLLQLLDTVAFAEGDVVKFTRIENIPEVALGLSLPVPPHAGGEGIAAAPGCLPGLGNACEQVRRYCPPARGSR